MNDRLNPPTERATLKQRWVDLQYLLVSEYLGAEYRFVRTEHQRKRPYQSLHWATIQQGIWFARFWYFVLPIAIVVEGPIIAWIGAAKIDVPVWLWVTIGIPHAIPLVLFVWFEMLSRDEPSTGWWPDDSLTLRERTFRKKFNKWFRYVGTGVLFLSLFSQLLARMK